MLQCAQWGTDEIQVLMTLFPSTMVAAQAKSKTVPLHLLYYLFLCGVMGLILIWEADTLNGKYCFVFNPLPTSYRKQKQIEDIKY